MDKVIFEHPLNEKMRILLRVEFLLSLIYANKECTSENSLSFFHALSELLDIIERNNIRSELIKEIELQKKKLISLKENDDGMTEEQEKLLETFKLYLSQLMSIHRLGSALKNDRFICTIRQRLSIPGGCCSFDLPVLHLWLSLSQEERNEQVTEWLSHLAMLNEILTICLKLTREIGRFKQFTCDGHFIKSVSTEVSLVRIRLCQRNNIYPQVSGHLSRYSIRFLEFGVYENKKLANVEFEVANC